MLFTLALQTAPTSGDHVVPIVGKKRSLDDLLDDYFYA